MATYDFEGKFHYTCNAENITEARKKFEADMRSFLNAWEVDMVSSDNDEDEDD